MLGRARGDAGKSSLRELEGYLVGEAHRPISPQLLRASGLAGHSYPNLKDHDSRVDLRSDFHRVTARHLALRAELARLLRAWEAEGVEALVFKGFHMAEFVYGTCGRRPYNDVDLLIRSHDLKTTCDAAAGLGWEVIWMAGQTDHMRSVRDPGYVGHEVAQLRHRKLHVVLDLHRRVVHNNHNLLPPARKHAELTKALWSSAPQLSWEGTRLRVPTAVDAVIFGLVLNRCWGSDEWHVKPRDYPDLQALVHRYGLERSQILERAEELEVQRTVAIYLNRCDPFRRILRLRSPTWLQRRCWNLAITPERGPRDLQHLACAIRSLPREATEVASMFPQVLRVLLARARGRTVFEIAQGARIGSGSQRCVGFREWRAIRRGVHRSLRLLRVSGKERDLLALSTACLELRRRGLKAWLEVDSQSGGCGVSLHVGEERVQGDGYLVEKTV